MELTEREYAALSGDAASAGNAKLYFGLVCSMGGIQSLEAYSPIQASAPSGS
jgi:hypothetical protein